MIPATLNFTHPTFWSEWDNQQPIQGVDDADAEADEEGCKSAMDQDWRWKRNIVGLWFGDNNADQIKSGARCPPRAR